MADALLDRHLTPADVADRLQVEPTTVVAWIRRGILPASRLPRGDYRIAPGDLSRVLRPAVQTRAAGPHLFAYRGASR